MDEQLIIEIWDTFKDNIPEKSRDAAATQFIEFLLDRDVDHDELEGVLGYDPHLDTAIQEVLDTIDHINDEDDFEEDDDWGFDEDEE